MDSNNFEHNCGVGEREARIFSRLVSQRHFGFGHGIGRSGDLMEPQPKAAGSSALNSLTASLILHLLQESGAQSTKEAFVVPMATGMALALCMTAYRKIRPKSARFVIWSRIDQKSCFKSIFAAGYEPYIVELKRDPETGQLTTDLPAIESAIKSLGADHVLCIFATTSCFAPRACDDLPGISAIVSQWDIPMLVNNAYGVQASKCMYLIEEARRVSKNQGKYNLFVQSTDKNLMVPVGGAIIAGFNQDWVLEVSKKYPGRASATPTMDVFITLLSMGLQGYKKLTKERKENFLHLKSGLQKLAKEFGEELIESKGNPISVAMTLNHLVTDDDQTHVNLKDQGKAVSELGSHLFTRGVSGTRVITSWETKKIEGIEFQGWGSHSNHTEGPYMTAAAAIGMNTMDIDLFLKRLRKVMESKSKFKPDSSQK